MDKNNNSNTHIIGGCWEIIIIPNNIEKFQNLFMSLLFQTLIKVINYNDYY